MTEQKIIQPDAEELALLDGDDEAWDNGFCGSQPQDEVLNLRVIAAFEEHGRSRTKQITTRLQERDLIKLKAKAESKGIPYQTLLSSIVHEYVEGTLRSTI